MNPYFIQRLAEDSRNRVRGRGVVKGVFVIARFFTKGHFVEFEIVSRTRTEPVHVRFGVKGLGPFCISILEQTGELRTKIAQTYVVFWRY